MNNNAAIYGPPSHRLDYMTMYLDRDPDTGAWYIMSLTGGSMTHKGSLWHLGSENFERWEGDDAAHLNLAQEAYVLLADFLRDEPNTEARARFVASGGLYEQLELFGE